MNGERTHLEGGTEREWLEGLRRDDRPLTDLEIANGSYLQYVETGDECYIANMHPDEMRAFIRDLGDRDRANNAARPGRGSSKVRHYLCPVCGATKEIRDHHGRNEFPVAVLCGWRGCTGQAMEDRG